MTEAAGKSLIKVQINLIPNRPFVFPLFTIKVTYWETVVVSVNLLPTIHFQAMPRRQKQGKKGDAFAKWITTLTLSGLLVFTL